MPDGAATNRTTSVYAGPVVQRAAPPGVREETAGVSNSLESSRHPSDNGNGAVIKRARSGTVRVFEREPDLLAGVPDSAHRMARNVAVAAMKLGRGPWRPPPGGDGSLGLLVLDGLLVRTVRVGGRDAPELIAARDLLRPSVEDPGFFSLPRSPSWQVLQPTTLAVLDRRFASCLAAYPSVAGNLLAWSVQRTQRAAVGLAIVHARRADKRLLMLLWHLAERFGRVTSEGVLVTLPLSHELLAQLTCLRRPTVSTTLGLLQGAGLIRQEAVGSWLLTGSPDDACE